MRFEQESLRLSEEFNTRKDRWTDRLNSWAPVEANDMTYVHQADIVGECEVWDILFMTVTPLPQSTSTESLPILWTTGHNSVKVRAHIRSGEGENINSWYSVWTIIKKVKTIFVMNMFCRFELPRFMEYRDMGLILCQHLPWDCSRKIESCEFCIHSQVRLGVTLGKLIRIVIEMR